MRLVNENAENVEEIMMSAENDCWVKHGKGKQTWPNGSFYEGYWHNGEIYGIGKYVYSNQDVYDGEFFAGKAHGRGTFK